MAVALDVDGENLISRADFRIGATVALTGGLTVIKKAIKYFLIFCVVCGVVNALAGCGTNNTDAPAAPKESAPAPKIETVKQPDPPKVTSFGMTLAQFQQAYKSNSVAITGHEFSIDDAQVKVGAAQDVFQKKFSDNVIVMGNIDKASGLVKEAWVLVSPTSADVMMDALITYGLIISVVSPELTTDQRGNLMLELKIMDERIKELANGNAQAIRGNVKYSTGVVKKGVFMFSASAKDL